MRRKKLLGITLCAVLTIGALLCCMQDASARETLLISGNADLYPIESYDRGRECYVGLLPELYERLSEQTGYDLVYLPYSKNTTQAQQTANRQADIISAYPSGTVDSGAMRRQVLLCTIEHDGAERAIYVGFTNALTPERAGALAQALEDLSGAESIGVLADYTNSSGAEAYRTRWLITLAALIAAMLAAAVALIVFARKKRAEQKANALIDPRYGIGNDRFYLHCVETLLPAPLRSIVYVICIGCDMPSLEWRFGEAEREEIFSRAAEYLRLGCAREDYLACVGRGMFALVCQRSSREAAQQRAEGLIRGLDGYLAGFRAEYAGAFRAGICSLSENPDCGAKAALYNARQGCAHAFRTETPCAFSTRGMIDESEQLERLRGSMSKAVEKGEFEPYLQFVVDRAGTVVGAEAVSRWQNPEEGLLPPSKYIDLMIRAGTVNPNYSGGAFTLRVRAAPDVEAGGARDAVALVQLHAPVHRRRKDPCARARDRRAVRLYARPPCGGADGGLLRARPRGGAADDRGAARDGASHRAGRYRRGLFLALRPEHLPNRRREDRPQHRDRVRLAACPRAAGGHDPSFARHGHPRAV